WSRIRRHSTTFRKDEMLDPATRRHQVIALMLSGIFPGIGQFYNRQPVKGAIGLVLGLALTWAAARAAPADPLALAHPGAHVLGPPFPLLARWGWSLIHPWRAAPHGTAHEPPC